MTDRVARARQPHDGLFRDAADEGHLPATLAEIAAVVRALDTLYAAAGRRGR